MKITVQVLMFTLMLTSFSLDSHRNITTLSNPKIFKYSPDQRVIAVTNKSTVGWYNAFTGKQMGIISYPFLQNEKTDRISSLDFSQDGKWLSLGFQTVQNYGSYVSAYFNLYKQAENNDLGEQSEINYDDEGSKTKDTVFLSNKYLLTVFQTEMIVQPVSGDQQFADYFSMHDLQIQKALPIEDNKFILGVIFSQNMSLAFINYQYNGENNEIKMNSFYEVQNCSISQIKDMDISADKQKVYFIGDSQSIFTLYLDTGDIDIFQIAQSTSQLNRLEVSNNQKFILTVDQNYLFFLQRMDDQDSGIQLNTTYSVTKINVSIPTATLSKSGGNIFYINSDGKNQISGICKQGEYFVQKQGTSKCMSCSQNCTLCVNQQKIQCFECNKGYFYDDSNLLCLACGTHCLDCSDAKSCKQCASGFDKIGQVCGCSQGYFDNKTKCIKCQQNCLSCQSLQKCKKCNDGFDNENGLCVQQSSYTWLIILLIIIGIIVVAVIVFLIYRKKKSQKHSLLSQEVTLRETTAE